MNYFLHLVVLFSVFMRLDGADDYWNDDYDETKNCKEEKTIEKLFSSRPDHCARESQGN